MIRTVTTITCDVDQATKTSFAGEIPQDKAEQMANAMGWQIREDAFRHVCPSCAFKHARAAEEAPTP